MPGIGEKSSYSLLPQQPMGGGAKSSAAAPNAVNMNGRTLDQLFDDFSKATGSNEAELRVAYGQGTMQFIVPSSDSGTPSMWTRFKAALSDLPLLNRVSSLRSAKLEVASLPLDLDDTVLRNRILDAVDNTARAKGLWKFDRFFARSLSDVTHDQLSGASPLTKRRVLQVLTSALKGIDDRAELAGRHNPRADLRREIVEHPAFNLKPTPAPHASDHDQVLFAECVATVTERIDRTDQTQIDQAAQELYARTQEFLVLKGAWPVTDRDAIAGVAAALDLTNR